VKSILITGGAGFIGVNSAAYFAQRGWRVALLDNLSRVGSAANLNWLRQQGEFEFHEVDIRDWASVERIIKVSRPDAILHLAAQVAVTSSVTDPRTDFEINAYGTFNLLEALRLHSRNSFFLFASTNKVYGKMENVEVEENGGRYEYKELRQGVREDQPLDFHSPYGCSKGIADQYTIDYARIYGIDSATFRQSCIYGTRQFGVEDQGWVAWFTIAAVLGRPITIYGDGKQIRDVLHVSDLVRAYEAAIENRENSRGQAFNMGGGPLNTLSLLELLSVLQSELQLNIPLGWGDWRPGDQPVFVCDISKAKERLGWAPRTDAKTGVSQLVKWVKENQELLRTTLGEG
jgi:CDP-paratose 2-epimerase